ncbi:MAG TPA: mechanosensitive ion channel family protein [Acholeplasma sp.]|nr:mechanosensitive ion channel family protein [Acholeplasma sp.]
MFDLMNASTGLNALYTALTVLFIVVFWVVQKKITKKHEDNLGKIGIFMVYFILLVVLLGGVVLVLFIWDYDLQRYLNDFGSGIKDVVEKSIGLFVSSMVVIFITLFILKVAKTSFNRVGLKAGINQRRKRTIAKLVMSLIRYVLGAIAILIVLSIWGVNVGPALAGLGIAGLVIGLGAQKFINDLIQGFFIVFEHHYDVGDMIEASGFKGEVLEIGLKTTKLKNWKGEIKIIANGDITTLINFSKNPSLAVVEFGISYGSNINHVVELLTEELGKFTKEMTQVIEAPIVSGVIALGDSSVNLRIVTKTYNEQHYGVERMIRRRIKEILDEHGIEIPFPQVVVHQSK